METTVPITEHILLLPRERCAGIPAIIKAGSEISPPPPAIESIRPARNTRGQTIRYCVSEISIFSSQYGRSADQGRCCTGSAPALMSYIFCMFLQMQLSVWPVYCSCRLLSSLFPGSHHVRLPSLFYMIAHQTWSDNSYAFSSMRNFASTQLLTSTPLPVRRHRLSRASLP